MYLSSNNLIIFNKKIFNIFFDNKIYQKNTKKLNLNFFFNENKLFKYKNLYKNYNLGLFFKFNKNYYYILNNNNIVYVQKFVNNILNNNKNFLILDSDYKNILPIYNFIYGPKNLYSNRSFFFISKKNVTLPSWIYFYKKFIEKYEIVFLIFLNYSDYVKFFKFFTKLNVFLFSIITQNYSPAYLDYYLYSSNYNIELNSLVFLNYLNYTYFYKYNYKTFLLKNKLITNIKKLI